MAATGRTAAVRAVRLRCHRFVQRAEWSPDGQTVASTATWAAPCRCSCSTSDARGAAAHLGRAERRSTWAPDSRHMAFVSDRSGYRQSGSSMWKPAASVRCSRRAARACRPGLRGCRRPHRRPLEIERTSTDETSTLAPAERSRRSGMAACGGKTPETTPAPAGINADSAAEADGYARTPSRGRNARPGARGSRTGAPARIATRWPRSESRRRRCGPCSRR